MRILFRLFGKKEPSNPALAEVLPGPAGYGMGMDMDLYYSCLREDRPYVIAMREVAADSCISAHC